MQRNAQYSKDKQLFRVLEIINIICITKFTERIFKLLKSYLILNNATVFNNKNNFCF